MFCLCCGEKGHRLGEGEWLTGGRVHMEAGEPPSYIVKKALKQNPTFSPFMPISPCVNEKIYFECAKQVKFHW